MNTRLNLLTSAAMLFAAASLAQDAATVVPASPKPDDGYAADILTVSDAQSQALQQAKEAMAQSEDAGSRAALQAAIREMEKAQAALDAAKTSPEKLGPALTAEQSAYEALLKATPHEFRISRSRNGQSGNSAGQPNERQLDQLEMKDEQNRYETERQAATAPTQQQREQSEIANRLRELAQRQQDLNDRLRELQTALQAAKTDQEREDIERQLKRLRDEERQMLADVDELRQKMEQSPNASSRAEARQQLDQTRSNVQRAADEIERNSPSEALAAGTRAQQAMQNLRDDLRRQTSSRFADQMRQLRSQARDLAKQEDDVAKKLDSLQNGEHKSLDTATENQQLADQLTKQENALTNLLSGVRAVSEQSENVEPLLSQKLYDTLRRAEQRRTDNLLEMGAQLAQRGFLPQTSEMESTARTNINELRQGVEAAAESVLGNETDSLRFAQKELDDLTRQVEREIGGGTNAAQSAMAGGAGQSNLLNTTTAPGVVRNGTNEQEVANRDGTNSQARAENRGNSPDSQQAQNDSERAQSDERSAANSQENSQSGNPDEQAKNGQNAEDGGSQQGNNSELLTAQHLREQNAEQAGNNSGGAQSGQNAQNGGHSQGDNSEQAAQNAGGQSSQQAGGDSGAAQNGNDAQNASNAQNGGTRGGDRVGGRLADRQRLSELARELGGGTYNGGGGPGGPLYGPDYLNWIDRLRDVEQVIDSPDSRYQLATVRERAGAIRQQFRQSGRPPNEQVVREQIVLPMTQVRVWLQEELARRENKNSLVPLDRDPVPDNYSELVRKYYEKLGSAQ